MSFTPLENEFRIMRDQAREAIRQFSKFMAEYRDAEIRHHLAHHVDGPLRGEMAAWRRKRRRRK